MDVGAFATVALGVLLFGLVSRRLQRGVVTPPMAFTCLGLLLGATGLVVLEEEVVRDSASPH